MPDRQSVSFWHDCCIQFNSKMCQACRMFAFELCPVIAKTDRIGMVLGGEAFFAPQRFSVLSPCELPFLRSNI